MKPSFSAGLKTLCVVLLASSALSLLHGCSGETVNENDPASLMKDAEEEIKSDHFQVAIDKLRAIKNKFPYSDVSVLAQLRIADVYFMQDSFAEAAASYEAFRDLHPNHEKVSYAMFRIGKSYFNDVPGTVARDLTTGQKALDAYNLFVKRFPADPQAAEAEKDIAQVRNMLADKELYVGNFYYRQSLYDSALPRFQKIIERYPETADAKEAQEKIAKIEKIPAAERKAMEEKDFDAKFKPESDSP